MALVGDGLPGMRTSATGGPAFGSLASTPRTSVTGGRGAPAPLPPAAASGMGLFGAPLTGAEREQAEAYFTDLLSYRCCAWHIENV